MLLVHLSRASESNCSWLCGKLFASCFQELFALLLISKISDRHVGFLQNHLASVTVKKKKHVLSPDVGTDLLY